MKKLIFLGICALVLTNKSIFSGSYSKETTPKVIDHAANKKSAQETRMKSYGMMHSNAGGAKKK